MTWQDRISQAAYTGAGSPRLTFDFEDVSQSFDKNAEAFNFPEVNGTFIQDLSVQGTKYPLRVFFHGADHDLQADQFLNVLRVQGSGLLEHPFYGQKTVVPVGTVNRRDDLKTAANQSVIEVTFWETLLDLYPQSQIDLSAAVTDAVQVFSESVVQEASNAINIDSVVDFTNFQNTVVGLAEIAQQFLRPLIAENAAARSIFDLTYAAITGGVNAQTVSQTLSQLASLIQTPAQSAMSFTDVENAYTSVSNSITQAPDAVLLPGYDASNTNTFFIRNLVVFSSTSARALASTSLNFFSKTESDSYALNLLTNFEDAETWAESNYTSLSKIDTGEAYQSLLNAVAYATAFLIQQGFSLKQERTTVLTAPATIIDLAYLLYGEIDGVLDFLINSNQLTGSEILSLPIGRRVKYYV